VHLVGFIIRIYHDARSPERQQETQDKTHAVTNHKHKRTENTQEQIASVKRQHEKYYNF